MLLNVDRAHRIMDQQGLDALVATSAVNVTYLSNYRSLGHEYYGTQIYAILPREDLKTSILILPLGEARDVIGSHLSWIHDIHPYGTFFIYTDTTALLDQDEARISALAAKPRKQRPLDALIHALASQGLTHIGLDDSNLPTSFHEVQKTIQRKLPHVTIRSASDLFYEIRKVKTPDELNRLKTAIQITEKAITAVLSIARPGVSGEVLATEYKRVVIQEGAFYAVPGIGLGTKSYLNNITQATTATLSRGDLIRFDAGCVYNWYHADIARTAVLGKSNTAQERLYRAVKMGEEAAIDALQPGVKASDVFWCGVNAVRASGIASYDRNHIGHAIGLQTYDRPVLTPNNESRIEEGMVLDIEIPYYVVGQGAFHVEDTVLVTASGAEVLTTLDRGLLTVNTG